MTSLRLTNMPKELTLEDLTKAELVEVILTHARPLPSGATLARVRRKRLMDEAQKESETALADIKATRDRAQWLKANERWEKAHEKLMRLIKEI